jgi:hypothetical protein
MFSGAHAPNAAWTPADFQRFRLGKFRAVELMWYHTLDDVANLQTLGCEYFLVRLPDSVDGTGRWRGDFEYAGICVDTIRKFAPLGIRNFQLDNEPNLTWPEASAGIWRWLLDRVIHIIRASPGVPGDVRLGLAPLSWKPATWDSIQDFWVPEQRKLIEGHQFLCVHSYWQAAGHYNLPPFGGNATHFNFMFGGQLSILITEWANSIHERGLPPDEVEAVRVQQYPQWLQWIATLPYVEATFLYILGGTPDWEGFWPSDNVLRAIATFDG